MANRSIQQKINKIKRMRRAHLKKYSMKNTGPGQKFLGFINDQGKYVGLETKTRNDAAKASPQIRYKKDSGGSWIIDQYLFSRFQFNEKSPEGLYARRAGLHTDLVILARYVKPEGPTAPHTEDPFVYQTMPDDRFVELRLYLGRKECFFIGFKTENGERVVYTSYPYVDIGRIYGRDLALKAQRDHNILWDTVEKFHTPPPADPNPTGT